MQCRYYDSLFHGMSLKLKCVNIGVNGIPYYLKFMYATCNHSLIVCVALAWWWSKWPKLVYKNSVLFDWIYIYIYIHIYIYTLLLYFSCIIQRDVLYKNVSSCSTLHASYFVNFRPASNSRGTGVLSPGIEWPERWTLEHVRTCSTGIGTEWSCNSTLLYAFNACAWAILPFIFAIKVHKP